MDDGVIVFVGIPMAIVWVIAIAVGVKRGFKYGALAFGIGVAVEVALVISLLVLYYSSGGH